MAFPFFCVNLQFKKKLFQKEVNSGFDFGTSAEKTSKTEAEVKLDKMNKEGLFHPSLFADQKKREERFIKNLYEIRQQALKTMKFRGSIGDSRPGLECSPP